MSCTDRPAPGDALRRAAILLGALFSLAAAEAAPARPPNILLIISDDHGYYDLGAYARAAPPATEIAPDTPRLDALAAQGARLFDFCVTSPVCTPSRAALLTGRHPTRYRFDTPGLGHEASRKEGLPRREPILPRYLKPAGYTTACVGKWHLGFAPGSRPLERGFDHFLGHAGGVIDYFTYRNLGHDDLFSGNDQLLPKPGGDDYSTDRFADEAIDFIGRNSARPWFLYLAFNAPHWTAALEDPKAFRPPQAPQRFLDRYAHVPEADRRGCLAAIAAMDEAIGRVLDRLDQLKLADDTLVIFLGDNGGQISAQGGGRNHPLREEKGTLFEGGLRVPCLVRWPGRVPAGTVVTAPVSALDLFPLVVSAAGAKTEGIAPGPLDGRDPLPLLRGEATALHERLGYRYRKQAAVREGRWKLVGPLQDNRLGQPVKLFDLAADLGETSDLAASQPEKAAELRAWFNEVWTPTIAADRALP